MPLLRRGIRSANPRIGSPAGKFKINADWWDALFKMLSIVLVPLTVAGMGWYWTRWQQNVNDLKSMIDLVTDKSPEKQKYGIAMFEYLAKNGKVPVEFLAAQIDYATTAREPRAAADARGRDPERVQGQPRRCGRLSHRAGAAPGARLHPRAQRRDLHLPCAAARRFKDADKASIIFPGRAQVPGLCRLNQELRFFHAEDKPRAEQIVGLFGTLGLELAVKDISATEWARTNAPNSYELWFTGNPMPKICQQAASG